MPFTERLLVWTDGACSGGSGVGGWAWVTKEGWVGLGGDPQTTNQRMELQAALDVSLHVTDRDLVIHSDSAYVVNCFEQGWWRKWRSNNFKGNSVANRDLWEPLIAAVVDGDNMIRFKKVKGHSGDVMNDLADHYAVLAKKEQTPTTRIRTVHRRNGTADDRRTYA